MKEKYRIIGMTCAACKNSVERSVKKLSGIRSVDVNLMTNIMFVDYDEKVISKSKIFIAIKSAGYDVSENIEANKDTSVKNMKRRLLLSIVFLIPLMYVSMGSMLMLPMPLFLTKSENYIWFSCLQILLVFPIIILNFNYFKVGFKRLFKLD
ncbi:MAG: cation transporter, partial [Bacilli bacterium]|nr:cation transporter [Bacilli bacterium]